MISFLGMHVKRQRIIGSCECIEYLQAQKTDVDTNADRYFRIIKHHSGLRSKLEADPANPELILTARGTGYLFQRIVDISPFDGK